jgi:hypothetical protein
MKRFLKKLAVLGVFVGVASTAACAHTSCQTPEVAMSKTLEGDPQEVLECWIEQEPDTYDRVWRCFVADAKGIFHVKTVRRLNVCEPS